MIAPTYSQALQLAIAKLLQILVIHTFNEKELARPQAELRIVPQSRQVNRQHPHRQIHRLQLDRKGSIRAGLQRHGRLNKAHGGNQSARPPGSLALAQLESALDPSPPLQNLVPAHDALRERSRSPMLRHL